MVPAMMSARRVSILAIWSADRTLATLSWAQPTPPSVSDRVTTSDLKVSSTTDLMAVHVAKSTCLIAQVSVPAGYRIGFLPMSTSQPMPHRPLSGPPASLRASNIPLPVSYTHLRAHETRHDLVCRLL